MVDKLVTNQNNDRLFNVDSKWFYYFRVFLVFFFLLAFLTSIGYWFYEIYSVYSIDIPDVDDFASAEEATHNLIEIFHESTHSQVAFEAAIISFLLLVAAYRL